MYNTFPNLWGTVHPAVFSAPSFVEVHPKILYRHLNPSEYRATQTASSYMEDIRQPDFGKLMRL